jgi:hypothetical protein
VTVPFDLATLLAEHQGESFELHSRFMNPQLVRPPKEALERATRWFVESGYVRADRAKRIRWEDR